METWKKHNYDLLRTNDGSPSLIWQDSVNQESMHHRGGAFSETMEIYGRPLEKLLAFGGKFIVSVGLGLGYNEILVAALSEKVKAENIKLMSYEKDLFLVTQFLDFVLRDSNDSEVAKTYQEILSLFKIIWKPELIRKKLLKMLQDKDWIILGELNKQSLPEGQVNCFLYDAFSSKSSPELWTEEFLVELSSRASDVCAFTTYACTGNLKRALRKTGFQICDRAGFSGKKQSVLAVKGFNLD